MRKTVAYVRVSTDEQAQSGLGIDAQLSAIEDRIGKPDVVFQDEGYGGADPERPGLRKAIESLRKGDVLAVAKRDRLARDPFLSLFIEKEVKKARASILSAAGEGTESEDPGQILMRRMVDAFAEYERAMIRQRTSAAVCAKMQKKKAGHEKTGGCIPFGFDVVQEANGVKRLIENNAEQQAIKAMQAMRERGESLRAICERLNENGVKTKTGTRWHPKTVRAILKRLDARAEEEKDSSSPHGSCCVCR